MAVTPAQRVQALLDDLRTVSPSPWTNVAAWGARAKPTFLQLFARFVPDLEKLLAEPPSPPIALVGSSASRWDDEYDRRRRGEQERRNQETLARAGERRRAAQATQYAALLSFVEGVLSVADLPPTGTSPGSVVYNAPVHHGDHVSATITGSNVSAVALGRGANATGSLNVSPDMAVSQKDLKEAVGALQVALLSMQDKLDAVHTDLYEYCVDLLLAVRKLSLDEKATAARVQTAAVDLFEDDLIKAKVAEMKPQALAKLGDVLKDAATIANNPIGKLIASAVAQGIGGS